MVHLLIPAAGVGRRMGSDRNKLLLPLRGQPILTWTLQAAAASRSIEWIGLICQAVDQPDLLNILATTALSKPVMLIPGGSTRQASVYNGLQALPSSADQVLIHDGARCLATPRSVRSLCRRVANLPRLDCRHSREGHHQGRGRRWRD